MDFDWKNNNSLKNCHICGQPVAKSRNSIAVALCDEHLRIWNEDIKNGLYKRNRLRDIMVERGQCPAEA